MKKIYNFSILSIMIVLLAASCNSASKAYKNGDYYRATINAIDKLRSKPNNEKAQKVLLDAYPLAQKTAMREIDNANLRNDVNKYDIMVTQYSRLNDIAGNIYNCPKAYELIPHPAEYQAEIADAKKKAAEQSYNLGIEALNYGTIEQARLAYAYFVKANDYVYEYKDVLNKIEQALYEGTLRILVNRPITSSKYQLSADFFSDNLIAEMSKQNQQKFIRFYTYEEANSLKMKNPHQYLVLNFADYTIGNVRETRNTEELKRDSVVVGTVAVGGKNYNAYSTVKAKYTTNRREIISSGVLTVQIIDAQTNRVLENKNFGGEYVWYTVWANYNGDERALNPQQKKLCNSQPQLPPPDQDLFISFTQPIYSQVLTFIRSVYR